MFELVLDEMFNPLISVKMGLDLLRCLLYNRVYHAHCAPQNHFLAHVVVQKTHV